MLQAQLHSLITRSSHVLLRAQRGLFAGKQRLTGNSISFSHRKYVPNRAPIILYTRAYCPRVLYTSSRRNKCQLANY